MKKFTKLICTIGPTCDSQKILQKLYDSGMNVARLNFSHGDHDYFKEVIRRIRNVSENIAIIADLKGPEIRTGEVRDGKIVLQDGQDLIITNRDIVGNENKITINYNFLDKVKVGNKILIDDGLIFAKVVEKKDDELRVRVSNGGELGSKKTVTIVGHDVDLPFLSKKDLADIDFAIKQNVDFLAVSFVRTREEVSEVRKILDKRKSHINIISKIEHPKGVDNFKEILEVSDVIMVARGDLGVEVKPEKVPQIQREIIQECRIYAKPVIVATHMLESMIVNPRPTRAEVSDVAQAVMQGTDAIMLSSETASGKYPVEATKMMTRIAREYDLTVPFKVIEDFAQAKEYHSDISLFIADAAYHASENLNLRAIVVLTETGFTAKGVSRFRPKVPIYAFTPHSQVLRQLQLSRNVHSFLRKNTETKRKDLIKFIANKLIKEDLLVKEDKIAFTMGSIMGKKGSTNMVEIYEVKELLDK
ncbi:MAG: pyruvate kinase [Nanoarchaeota archaeon]|nr:pyruvate kinase [Nanoarchaeota archaeon]